LPPYDRCKPYRIQEATYNTKRRGINMHQDAKVRLPNCSKLLPTLTAVHRPVEAAHGTPTRVSRVFAN
jgi:hypothetical protein